VKIPLPDLMRKLRERQFDGHLRPWTERLGIHAWAWLAVRPGLYAFAMKWAARVGSWLGGRDGLIHSLPGLDGWTKGRDMPAPSGRTFRDLYRERRGPR
jgi:L-lactate dehydrogenase complex protein LldF